MDYLVWFVGAMKIITPRLKIPLRKTLPRLQLIVSSGESLLIIILYY